MHPLSKNHATLFLQIFTLTYTLLYFRPLLRNSFFLGLRSGDLVVVDRLILVDLRLGLCNCRTVSSVRRNVLKILDSKFKLIKNFLYCDSCRYCDYQSISVSLDCPTLHNFLINTRKVSRNWKVLGNRNQLFLTRGFHVLFVHTIFMCNIRLRTTKVSKINTTIFLCIHKIRTLMAIFYPYVWYINF